MDFPKYDKNSQKGGRGLTIVKSIIQDNFGWVFRKNHQEEDFGIDAYLDVVTKVGQVTGKSVAVQIKTGSSFFKESNEIGWVFRGEMKHLNYYLNHDIPVVIIIVDEESRIAYWCLCDAQKTIKAGENWKLIIPRKNILNAEAKDSFEKFISPVTDYVSQMEHFWEMNKMLTTTSRLLFIVGKEDIEKGNYLNLVMAFKRIEANYELIVHNRSNVEVAIHGYDFDDRELFAVPEVVAWIKSIFPLIDSWAYFLATDEAGHFMKLLFIVHANVKKILPGKIEYETKDSAEFVNAVFSGLNVFCDRHSIGEEVNMEQCNKFMDCVTDGQFSRDFGQM